MTFPNDLESQIKLLIRVESKAGSGTPAMQTITTEVTKLSQNNLSFFTVHGNNTQFLCCSFAFELLK